MATTGYASALGGLAKDAVIGAGKGFVGGLKGAMMSEAPGLTGAYAFAKELRKRANAPKMPSGGSAPPSANKPSSSSPMAGGLGVTNEKTIVGVLRQSNIINLEQVSQLKQLNANVINQSKLLKFTVDDTKRKDQFAEEVAKEQAFRDDRLLEAIKKIGGGFGSKGKAGAADEGKGGGLGGLIGDYGKELALGGLAVLFRKQIASVLARIVASPLTGMAVNAAIAGGSFLATIGSGLAAALRIILTTALRALVMNPIGLAALGLGALFTASRNKEKQQTENAIKNNLPVAPMPTKTFRQEAKELKKQAETKTGVDRVGLLEKAKQADNNIAQEELNVKDKDGNPAAPLSLFQRQKAWNEKYGKSHNPDGTPKAATSSAPSPAGAPNATSADDVYRLNQRIQEAQKRGEEEKKNIPMPTAVGQAKTDWLDKYEGRKDPITGKSIEGISNYPITGMVISLKGKRESPGGVGSTNHNGVDIAAAQGSPVFPSNPGTVKHVERDGGKPDANGIKNGLGRFVLVEHNNGYETKYAHLKTVNVQPGQIVGPGVMLGTSGGNKDDPGSGATTGEHLHFELIKSGVSMDPARMLGLSRLGIIGAGVSLAGAAIGAKVGPTSPPPATTAPPASAAAQGAAASAYDPMKPAGWTPPPLGGAANLVAPTPFQNDLPQFQNLLGGAKPVAPKNTSTDSEREAEIKKIVDKFEEVMKTILKDIKNLKDKIGDSNSAVDSNFIAGYNLNSPLFAKQTNIQANPNAHVMAFHDLFGFAKVTSDAGPRGGKPVINLNAGDSAKEEDRFHKIENRRIDENIARIEDERKRVFLTAEKSSYGNNTPAGVEVSKESNPLVAFIERLLEIVYSQRSSPVKLGPSYFNDMHVNDLFRKTERDFRVKSDKLASGTEVKDGKPINTYDEELNKKFEEFRGAKFGSGGPAKTLQTYVVSNGKLLPTQAPPPFKPNFRGNTQILAEANKQFLNELRSTFTGLARKGLQDALLPNGVGVSFAQASQDNLFRGQQLKQINDTSKKISEGAVKLFGNKFGPMFAPMLDKLSTSYFEVGSRLVGRQLFTRFGGLDDKETMGITGQVLGNIAAGKKQLAAEQLLFGMSGGRERGIALNAESLFAKYGFEDSQQGISYFADVLGEKATQPFSKVFGADDRNKSIIRDPRSGKLVYADSGKEATKDDIKAGYGGRISQTPLLGKENEYMEVPGYPGSVAGTGGPNDDYAIKDAKGKIIGRKAGGMKDDGTTNSSVTGGSFSAAASKSAVGGGTIKEILNADPKNISRNTVFGTTEAERIAGGDALRAKENTYVAAQVELLNRSIQQERDLANAAAKREHDEAQKLANSKEESDKATNNYNKTLTEIQNANADVNATAVIKKLDDGQKGGVGDGTTPPGLRASGRRPGQLFDANVYDKDGKIEGKDPMKEIGNFGFDILKLGVGSELTKGISNPYMQTITNFAIQKGMNYAIDSIMDSNIFSKMGSAASSSSSSYGGIGDIFSSAFSFLGFQTGGPVKGAGTGTSDSIPAYLSNGEFVVNAKAAAANMKLLNAINQSTLPKKNTSGSGTYVNDGGPGSQSDFGGSGSPFGGLGVGPGQGVSTSTQSLALGVMAFADKYPSWAPLGFAVKIAGWLAGKAADSQMDKMADAMKAIDAIDKANAASLASGSSRTFDPYNGQKGVLSVSDKDGNIKSFDPYAGDSAKDADRSAKAPAPSKGDAVLGPRTADALASFLGAAADLGKPGGGDVAEGSGATPGERGGEHLAKGGLITGKGSGTSDSIFSMLSNGEFVINAKATKANLALIKQINSYSGSGSVPKSEYDSNLSIEPFKNTFKGFAAGGLVAAANKSSTMNAVPRPTSRSPYILSPPTNNSSSENQNNSSNMIIGPKTSTRIDNSSVTNFYNQASGMIDSIRSITPQVA